ncbi:hypothetical protein Tco_1157082 [Tanacetum coccineum]
MFDESLNPPPYVDLQALEVIAPIPEVVAPEHAPSDTPWCEKSKLDGIKKGSCRSITLSVAWPTEKHLNAHLQMRIMLVVKIHRSSSGSIQLLGDRLVSWSSKRQKSAAISSTEAEYIALSVSIGGHASQEALAVKELNSNNKLDSNPVIILKASIPTKRELDLTTGIYFLGHGLLHDHAKACDYFASQPVLPIFHNNSFLNRIMEISKADQIALDDALVAPAKPT